LHKCGRFFYQIIKSNKSNKKSNKSNNVARIDFKNRLRLASFIDVVLNKVVIYRQMRWKDDHD
jgi:hypothetical protein